MKVLVTGGAGFIGSHIVDSYLATGYEVVVVDDLSSGNRDNLNASAKFYKMDIRSPELMEVFERERPDFVNHLAAQVNVRLSTVKPLIDADVNVKGTLNVLECARTYSTSHLIYSSTGGAVYGDPNYLPCDEEHAIQPLSQYGVSKYAAELYILAYFRLFGINYTVLRYSNVYGPRQDPRGEAGVVAKFIGSMLKGNQPTIYGDGNQQRDFLYVGDCARANMLAQSAKICGIFNISTGTGTKIEELFVRIRGITHYQGDPKYVAAKQGEVLNSSLDASKAARELGWQPEISLEQGLVDTVAFIKQSESDI